MTYSTTMNDALHFRLLTHQDIHRLAVIEANASPYPWGENIFRDCINGGYIAMGAVLNERIIGFYFISIYDEVLDILNIAVDSAYQGQGYGKQLLNHLHDYAAGESVAECFLEVRESNIRAQKLYQQAGYRKLNTRRGYYRAGNRRENALVMRKRLAPS